MSKTHLVEKRYRVNLKKETRLDTKKKKTKEES